MASVWWRQRRPTLSIRLQQFGWPHETNGLRMLELDQINTFLNPLRWPGCIGADGLAVSHVLLLPDFTPHRPFCLFLTILPEPLA
ncbi:unnamed protein product, partial [Protopolystoma xenopodis]